MSQDITAEILSELTKFTDEERKRAKKIVMQEARKCAAELRSVSPVAKVVERNGKKYYEFENGEKVTHLTSGKYRQNWKATKAEETTLSVEMVVHNGKTGSLTHLLEYGHENRDGSMTEPIKHIEKCNENAIERILERIEND